MIAPIDFPPDLMMFGSVCCFSLRSFLARNWCGYAITLFSRPSSSILNRGGGKDVGMRQSEERAMPVE
jgi:hypothetical protein